MTKDIKDYLHLYLGCEVQIINYEEPKRRGTFIGYFDENKWSARIRFRAGTEGQANLLFIKPILRPLSDMSEEEMIEIIQLSIPDHIKEKPTSDNYDLDIFYNDGGNLVDANVVIGAEYTCICYIGQIVILKCGTINFFDENGNNQEAYNMPKVYTYLLSKHFDLFGLIEAGLAIDKTTLK